MPGGRKGLSSRDGGDHVAQRVSLAGDVGVRVHGDVGPLGERVGQRVDVEVVGVLVGDQHRVDAVQRRPLAERFPDR